MRSDPSVSVLVPARNAAPWIEPAIHSLLGQTLREIEIIAVDDGSTDDTAERLQRLALTDPRLRLLRQAAGGIVAALHRAAAAARAPLLARMDADDLSLPDRLAAQRALISTRPELVAVSCLVAPLANPQARPVEAGWQTYLDWVNSCTTPAAIERELFVESPLPHPSVLMRREAFEGAGGYRAFDGPEDYDLWLRMAAAGGRFAKVERVLLRWRDHPGRLTRTDARYRAEAFARLKARHLAAGPLTRSDTRRRPLAIWGAGRTGRFLGRALEQCGCRISVFVDIDQRKIGRTRRRNIPVVSPDELLILERAFVLGAVPLADARRRIRCFLAGHGRREGRDFILCA